MVNRNGIALAADSASTFYHPLNLHSKTYNSANKLFMLSYSEPIGIMIYGQADLAGIPWEPLCKYYRETLGLNAFSSLKEYASHFLTFIEENEDLFPANARESSLQNFFSHVFQALWAYVTQGIMTTDEKQFLGRLEHEIALACTRLKEAPYDEDVMDISDGVIDKSIDVALEGVFPSSVLNSVRNQLHTLGKFLIQKGYEELPVGIVLAGYGTREIFGSVLHYKIGPFVGHKLKKRLISEDSVAELGAVVRAYAQQDVISLFMNGIDATIYRAVLDNVAEILRGVGVADEKIHDITASFQDKLAKMMQDFSSAQVMEAIRYLPKEELATFAEALVALTVLKRHVSLDSETVGGPVDVAVLSKGDGFVWVKRKHYFDPNLNPYYFARLKAKFQVP